MRLEFTKMHGLGNDFMVLDARAGIDLTKSQILWLANRHFGIGCDQILLVENSEIADFKYRIFNADGGEVAQCGNGARCFARFVYENKFIDKKTITVETKAGLMTLCIHEDNTVEVNMGIPMFEPSNIPLNTTEEKLQYTLEIAGQDIVFSSVSMGNPHAVIQVQDIDFAPVVELGSIMGQDNFFPQGVNIGFMQTLNKNHIKLRVFERGSGETLACGSGACAASVCGIRLGILSSPVTVTLPGGDLSIIWQGLNNPVMMTGPASFVFQGVIEI